MKVLHLTNTDARFDSRILKELQSLINCKEFNIELIAYGINNSLIYEYDKTFIQHIRIFKLVTKYVKVLPRFFVYSLNLLESIFRLTFPAIKYRPNVIHCHDSLFLPIALIVRFFCKSKLIYDAHELESQKNGQKFLFSKVTLFIEKISWKYIDVLITVSPSISNWYQKNLGYKESLLIFNSPQLNTDRIDTISNNYLRDKFNIPKNCKVFIYIGIIGRGRGIDLYLKVFQSLDINSHIVFIGYGEYVTKVQDASKINEKIHYHPAVKHDEIINISKSADVGLVMIEDISLSDYFCLPNKLFESAFSGLFILASDFPDIKKIIEDYELGMVCSVDINSIKKAIIELEHSMIFSSTKDLYEISWNYQSVKLINLYKGLYKFINQP